jgi:hypothetical protein
MQVLRKGEQLKIVKNGQIGGCKYETRYISGVHVAQFVALCVRFVDHCLSFLSWPLYCLSCFELRLLITS